MLTLWNWSQWIQKYAKYKNLQISQATGIGTSLHPTDSLDVWGVKAFVVHHPPPDLDEKHKMKKLGVIRH